MNTTTTKWLLDSRASSHLSNNSSQFLNSTPYQGRDHITVGNGENVKISIQGQCILLTPSRKFILSKVLHAPNLAHNFLSVNKLTCDNNYANIFMTMGML